jgi:hypothetical protein
VHKNLCKSETYLPCGRFEIRSTTKEPQYWRRYLCRVPRCELLRRLSLDQTTCHFWHSHEDSSSKVKFHSNYREILTSTESGVLGFDSFPNLSAAVRILIPLLGVALVLPSLICRQTCSNLF